MAELGHRAIDWEMATARLSGILRDLIRIDTSNPPGNETPAAQYMADVLAGAGIPTRVAGHAPDRCSAVARLSGSGRKRPLLLLSHLDVVPAQAEDWIYPPFEGVLDAQGTIWGRGATDCKGLVAQEVVILLLLKEAGVALDRDVILAATADEESIDPLGILWLLAEHPDWIDAEFCINEGGGESYRLGDRTFYLCQAGEKGPCPLRLTARGQAGHGSVPHADSAIVHLARAIDRLAHAELPVHLTGTVRSFLDGLGDRLPLLAAHEREMIQAMQRNTVVPTWLQAGYRINVIPAAAEAQIDCRVVPGQTQESVLAEVRAAIGDLPVSVEVIDYKPGMEFGTDTELYGLIQAVTTRHDPEGTVIPFLQPGTTDGVLLARRGTAVYGFSPIPPDPEVNYAELAHTHNERIPLAGLAFGLRVLFDIVKELCAAVK